MCVATTLIPQLIKEASREFASKEQLADDWFNNRVVNLDSCKPFGWGNDLVSLFEGSNLSLFSVSRKNLLRIKLFSACDRPEGLTIDIPDIYQRYIRYIYGYGIYFDVGLYLVYTWYILSTLVYTWYIPGIYCLYMSV